MLSTEILFFQTLPQLPNVNGLSSQSAQQVAGSPSMSALQLPQMTSSGGINLNMLTLQQLLTGSPLTLPNGSTSKHSIFISEFLVKHLTFYVKGFREIQNR